MVQALHVGQRLRSLSSCCKQFLQVCTCYVKYRNLNTQYLTLTVSQPVISIKTKQYAGLMKNVFFIHRQIPLSLLAEKCAKE